MLAFAPSGVAAGADPHHQRILAAIRLLGHFRHRQVEGIDRIDLHGLSLTAQLYCLMPTHYCLFV